MRRSTSTMRSATPVSFDRPLERVEVLLPHLTEQGTYRAERVAVGPVEALGPLPPLADEASRAQNFEVLRDGRPAHVEPRCDLPGRELSVPDQAEDLASPRTADRVEHRLHAGYL